MTRLALVFASAVIAVSACSTSPQQPLSTTTTLFNGTVVEVNPETVFAGPGTIMVDYTLPDGYKVNGDAPSSFVISAGSSVVEFATDDAGDLTGTDLPGIVPVTFLEGTATVEIEVSLIYCRAIDTDLCLSDTARFVVPLEVGPPGASSIITIDRGGVLPAG